MNQCASCDKWFQPPAGDDDKDYCCKAHEPSFQLRLELLEPDFSDDDLLPEGF